MLEEEVEEVTAALSRVCVMRDVDALVLRSASWTSEERQACRRREAWRERREAELLGQLGAWQAKFVGGWEERTAAWRRSGAALREVEEECWAVASHITLSDLVSGPFAMLDECSWLFSPLGPCAGLFRAVMKRDTEGAERRDEAAAAAALAENVCPATTSGMRQTRQLLMESRRAWRLLVFAWGRFLLAQRERPSSAVCLVLTSAAAQFLRMRRREFQKTLATTGRRTGGGLPSA
ncbi:hypothetical protein TraAM80_03484 [Trypanosoma rangeli]|uniref:Uncharacterized protein n=1 Tax=Trypanosoma rangeli TaxID=5698 RepID=A0A3R7MRW3_TRYRA|nr:uncharacterized protein TraAM80_03484 [Trypanosoma rangeli]RNF07132.1 hypothetical protein TraAM80_03484 [Trypanosoma rangeli]|eukprot:RNF07132.1 hypothetical protein TraAM80_03484 [Trypanosoma rangeli]